MTSRGLFAEFDQVSQEQWLAAVERSLRGRSLASLIKRSYEGIDIHPLTSERDLADIAHVESLPGQFPFARGAEAAGYLARPWLIAQEIDIADPADFNRALQDALANGQTAIMLGDQNSFQDAAALSAAFAGIDLASLPILLAGDEDVVTTCRLLKSQLGSDKVTRLQGCLGYDPLRGLAKFGRMNDDAFNLMASYVAEAHDDSPGLGTIAVSGAIYFEAGANAVQELALVAATATAYLHAMIERDLDINHTARAMHGFLCIGEDFFMSVAKLRAIKAIWAQIIRAFGGDEMSQKLRLHARSGQRNKSRLDPQVNMLRATSEALAAAIGGVDSLTLTPFDAPLGRTDDFSRRLARNVQLILQEELQLTGLIDPAGGSWHVERLTDQLARAAWKRFQAIEAGGGVLAGLQSGRVQAEIEAVAERRQSDLQSGAAVLVGVNKYAKPDESLPAGQPRKEVEPAELDAADCITVRALQARRLTEPFEAGADRSRADA